jgi:hypothetical protein
MSYNGNPGEPILYDFEDQLNGRGFISEPFSGELFEYREASKTYPIITDLHPVITGFPAVIGVTENPGNTKNGTLMLNHGGAAGVTASNLLRDVKEDGTIKSVTLIIVGSALANKDIEGLTPKEQYNNYKNGMEYLGSQLKVLFEKAGVKNVNVQTDFHGGQPDIKPEIKVHFSR